jgi:hypothetical protein
MAYLKYSDVPIFANFVEDGGITEIISAKHMFAASDISINLDSNSAIKRFLGGSKPEINPQGPLEAKISMTFFPMIENSTTTNLLNLQRQNQISFFNLTGDFVLGHNLNVSNLTFKQTYLQNYSIKINPYQPVSVTANFISYDISSAEDKTLEKGKSFQIAANTSKPTYEALHGLTTTLTTVSGVSLLPQTKTSIEINVNCQRTPIYPIGKRTPDSVKLISVERDINIQGEGIGKIMNFQGQDVPDMAIYFLPLSQLGTPASFSKNVLSFNVNGKILSKQISVSQNSIANGRLSIKEVIL